MTSVHQTESHSIELPPTSVASSHPVPGLSIPHSVTQGVMEGDKLGLEGRSEVVEREQQVTPRKSNTPPGGLLPAFGVNNASHLPTPQSPSNVDAFHATFGFSPVSPLHQSSQTHRLSAAQYMSQQLSSSEGRPLSPSQSFMTPDSSPFIARRITRSHEESNMDHTAISVLSSPFTPRPSSEAESAHSFSAASQLHTLSPPLSRATTPTSSRLSSPFMERLSLTNRTRSKTRTPIRILAPADSLASSHLTIGDVVFSPGPSSKTPPLSAPVPQRAGAEIHRIRLQMAAEEAARIAEMEAKRPDYLIREKRLQPDVIASDDLDWADQDMSQPIIGVTISPVKGRRIQLFQETSEESFEQSLLAGGYPGYGSTTTLEPQTPDNQSKSGLSQRALLWLQQATPGQPSPGVSAAEPEVDSVPSEKEIRKRKRLAAFQDNPERTEPPAKLHPVEMEGKGRVLLNVPPTDNPSPFETPTRKRGNNRRRRKLGAHVPGSKRGHLDQQSEYMEIQGPNWIDSAFPWCVRSQERTEMARLEQEDRLRRIERYLDHDSDSDDGAINEDQALHPLVRDEDEQDPPPPRGGRGKMIPLRVAQHTGSSAQDRNSMVVVPSDPADARAALLSKRSVRALATRLQRTEYDDEQSYEETVCVCGGGDDGRPLVQCDDCRTWYHLACVGIKDPRELGREEDPWFCPECLGVGPVGLSDPPSQPTFVPTDDRPPVDGRRDPLFYQASLHESPSIQWSSSRDPETPIRGRDLSQTFASRSSWGDSSRPEPSTPVSTAHTVRIYSTPGPFESPAHFDSPFDPNKTPSRAPKSNAFATPKSALFSTRLNDPMRTPGALGSNPWKISGGSLSFGNFGSNNISPSRQFRNIYSFDDTPIRRSGPREQSATLAGRRLWESPLAAKSVTPRHGLHQDSALGMIESDEHGRQTAVIAIGADDSS